MVCSQSSLELLEFPQLRLLLAGQTVSVPGRLLAEQLLPLDDQAAIETCLAEVDEAVALLEQGSAPPLGENRELAALLEQVQAEGSFLPGELLLEVVASLEAARRCHDWFRERRQSRRLAELADRLVLLPQLSERLRRAIGPRGELLDSASAELGEIRRELRQTRARVKQQLEQLLASDRLAACFQERLITVRNGRYVVPLKADHRGQLKGFVQDESASGQTLYLEPAQTLAGNNRLQQLLREEQREERRVLLQLAEQIRQESLPLSCNQELLARLDLRLAAGRLSRAYRGCSPQLMAEPLVELREARHPLLMRDAEGRLEPERAVAIDLLLAADCQALVISGPNTGGKSVGLKTLGLMLLMLRAGLHLPCHPQSRLHLFRRLYVDIGDEQSIAESLSTFSGHLLRIKQILEQADREALVLLDEAGTGTDPAEGAALALAVLDRLRQQGAKTVLTTHLGQIKAYAQRQQGVESAAVEFDPQTLAPAYRLHYGIPGASSAMRTARRLGLPETILAAAADYLGERAQDSAELIAQLNQQRQQLEQELAAARSEHQAARRQQQRRLEQLQQLKSSKREILTAAAQRGEQLIQETEKRLKQLQKRPSSPKEAVALRQELSGLREELQPFKPSPPRPGRLPSQLEVGELVRITALGAEAKVERISGETVELLVGGKRLRQPLASLEQFQPRRFAGQQSVGAGWVARVKRAEPDAGFQTRLKLVGRRVDEALPLLERFIDDALLHNLRQVEIIHGSGEGILRRAVREFLAGQAAVSAFYAAAIEQGGENVTIAELGD